jgi:uncharacterized protein with ParB-like and HNH nuclease domain
MGNSSIKIKDILANDTYIIPRYQRNYAWGKTEISQLIKDIEEFFKENNNKKYYLGSLVCFKRDNGNFELIDGQQRHTTITLINLVLKNWQLTIAGFVPKTNLKFDSRKKMQNYLENLYETGSPNFLKQINGLNISGTSSFKVAIEIIQEELREKDVQKFALNFYENVYLFRVEVPEDTDLNHYFEIMNNRGEQLEKHEIVKALLMEKISDSKEQRKFAIIWDACAEMNNYTYFNFEKSIRENLFNSIGNLKGENFESISVNESENDDEEFSLSEIIEKHDIPNDFPKEEKNFKDKYKSIIDFPNFLLQVLKINTDQAIVDDKKQVALDDKKLLEEFKRIDPKPEEFIFDLLKYRVLFDKFVIKQDLSDADESKQNWGIRKLNTDFETTIKTFEADEELTKLQVMLYYSDSTNTYNNWLQEILKNEDFTLEKYTEKVINIVKNKFNKSNLTYPHISIFNLYFIDFLLWKLYAEKIKGIEAFIDDHIDKLNDLKKKIFNQRTNFHSFKFKQLNSKEHLFSQSQSILHFGKIESFIDGIGNLCLISTSENSSGNKENPIEKKIRFADKNSSLKRLIMFESYENGKWEEEQIKIHETEINELIKSLI